MTLKQFYRALAKVAKKRKFVFHGNMFGPGGEYIRTGRNNNLCPIEAVARSKGIRTYYINAGRKLGLSDRSIRKIVSAADSEFTLYSGTRAKLLKAVGLKKGV